MISYIAAILIIVVTTIVLVACGSGSSNTGRSTELPAEVYEARAIIRPFYPEAAAMPVYISDKYGAENWGYYVNGWIILTNLWVKEFAMYKKEAACVLAHEWVHSKQVGTKAGTYYREVAQAEANKVQDECIRKI